MRPKSSNSQTDSQADGDAARAARPGPPTTAIAPDCRHYRGDRPCPQNRLCTGCGHYEPWTARICIIKLGALGDVIRTLGILPALHEAHPGAQITWVSQRNGCRMLAGHPQIDRVLPFTPGTCMTLAREKFDLVISLDKEPQPCALAVSLRAGRKLGVGLSEWGTPMPLNAEAEAYFQLGLSDELKFRQNTRSYPELVHAALGLRYSGRRYELPVRDQAVADARMKLLIRGWRPHGPTIGVNVGAGRAFANKMWPADRVIRVIQQLRAIEPAAQVVLLGGRDEAATVQRVKAAVGDAIDPGADHDEPAFVALVDQCDVIFSGDTMAMHVAVARGKGVVAVFGPTCEQEIDLYGLGEKLVARVACGPCYKRVCDHGDACVSAPHADAGAAAEAITRVLLRVRAQNFGPVGVPLVGGTPQTSADAAPAHWSGEYARPVAPDPAAPSRTSIPLPVLPPSRRKAG